MAGMGAVPTFETERLLLRPVTLDDVPSYTRQFVDYEVIRELSAASVPWPYPPDGVRDFLANVVLPRQGNDHWLWAICERPVPAEVIGCIDLWREGRPEHRGFWLGRAFWGRGYMSEAVVPVLDYAFDTLGFEKLVFSNALGNRRSRRIKEKTGAHFLRLEEGHFVDPAYDQREIWELTRAEWRAFKARETTAGNQNRQQDRQQGGHHHGRGTGARRR